jgi:GntR family transcriptional regulator
MPRRMTFRQIADDIAARINAGEYQPAAQIPSYQQLAHIYSVSISTAQRAVLVLQERGLVYGEPGRGVFVHEEA